MKIKERNENFTNINMRLYVYSYIYVNEFYIKILTSFL